MEGHLLMILLFVSGVLSFNIHVPSKVVHFPNRQHCGSDSSCMFGFSVAQHKPMNGTSWLLIGAPEADLNIAGVKKSGGVYKCTPERSGSCEIIPFDMEGNSFTSSGEQYDNKSGQWFGSLVRSSGSSDVVLACAPRYIWFSPPNYKRREPVGMCYTAQKNFQEFYEYSPCSTKKWGYHRQGSCQAGFGADISDDGEYIFVGAVGSWYWQGQIFSQKLNSRVQHRTKESSPSDDDSYLGYSLTTGEFNGDGDRKDIAVGMPRGANLTGKVILYDSKMRNLNNLTGDQIGAYFGYSVSSGDFNGDGLDDIAIGAPMWTDYRVMGQFEVGRVYIVYQNRENRFVKWSSIDGSNHKARFGLSVASGGNLDLDGIPSGEKEGGGYQDLLVGAPYDGEDHRGALYVYLGSEEGIRSQHSQVIYANEINPSIKTFGWSISAGHDMDSNHYPDVLVGAYDSSQAVYLKSSPVIHLNSDLKFLVKSKEINLEEKKCSLKSGRTRVPCIDAQIQLSYDGVGIPNRLRLELVYILDAKKERSKRMFFLEDEGQSEKRQSIQVLKGHVWKKTFTVYLLPSRLHDKLSSLDLKIKYALENDNNDMQARSYSEIPPVISLDDRSVMDSISIKKDCGIDNECIPNLILKSDYPQSYTIGSDEKLQLSTDISNSGEDAFNAYLYVSVPKGVNYIKTKTSAGSSVSVLCSPPNQMNNRTLKCEIGNPLPSNSQVKLDIMFQPIEDDTTHGEMLSKSYDFSLSVNSSNPEEGIHMSDNVEEINIDIQVHAQVKLSGTSKPEQVSYNLTGILPDKYTIEDEIGEEIVHIYDVNNKGPSPIQEADIFIMWPSFTDNGKHSLYLLGVDYDANLVQCEPIDNINPLYVKTIGSRNYSRIRAELLRSRPSAFDWWARKPTNNDNGPNNGGPSESILSTHSSNNKRINTQTVYHHDQYNTDTRRHHSSSTESTNRQGHGGSSGSYQNQMESWQKLANGSYIKIFHSSNVGANSADGSAPPSGSSWSGSSNSASGGSSWSGSSDSVSGGSFNSASGGSSDSVSGGSSWSGSSNSASGGSSWSASSGGVQHYQYHPEQNVEQQQNTQFSDNSQTINSYDQGYFESNYGNANSGSSHVDHILTNGNEQLLYSENGNWEWSEDLNKWKWVGEKDNVVDQNKIKRKKRSVVFAEDLRQSKSLFEGIKKNRYRRQTDELLNEELRECRSNKCTLIQCRVGPLEKDESVIFKIRSRLYTQSHIEDYQKKVSVSSKILARVTKLPYQQTPSESEEQYLTDFVTTEVFPIQLGSETVAWWVWVLAAIFGLLLLLLISYCLYRCGFFRRKRPDTSPEREPLNSCH